ncbi:ammonium transporter [Gracilinema caldarium]|uniref:Ammonium transporter n=1 Tax=Gracilinema caldarium (strain ATCC 51460 / DSM 7334 / H1) TaxID=744872 RepID=F8F1U4_GRAC1|nr:ammonium transporter [Gracilinema caldarium]AEJ19791.1 ammonium transporter [Gracilinema caldarium DSM 7334]
MKKQMLFLAVLFFLVTVAGFAEESIESITAAMDMIWLVLTGALVFFMQAGFALVETGLTRAKNATNIIMKNLMDFCLGSIAFWMIGWGFMYGADKLGGLIGFSDFFKGPMGDPTFYRDWFFQVVFAATAATIVSGAMAERTQFKSYLIYTVFISALIYPVSGHWIWGGGWLSELGFHDFAGSTVVHSVGGWAALMGAIVLGPRTGKYVKAEGKVVVKALPGHNIPLAALGVFILWFGWYGFNPGSTLSGISTDIARVAVTTTLAASAGAVAAMIVSWFWFKKPDASMTMNGVLAGLVAITAPCAVVSPGAAVVIGLLAGLLVVLSVEFIDKVLKIDDPVGAVSVHMVNGVFGTLAVGIWGNVDGVAVGVLHGGGFHQLGVQALGVLTVGLWASVLSLLLFLAIKAVVGLRVTEKEELMGLDITEHKAEAYSGFQIFSNM